MSKAVLTRLSFLAACALAWTGCTISQQEAPELSGPSELALSFSVAASPDQISQDGAATSAITLKAFGPNGQAAASVPFRLEIMVDGTSVDYGTLSAKNVTTNSNGQAVISYTAPPALPAGANLSSCAAGIFDPSVAGGCIQIVATPIGTNYVTDRSQEVTIRLLPVGTILPPAMTPTPNFTFSPASPTANVPVHFDASASCPGPATAGGCQAAGSITAYEWSFSDGATATGKITSHAFGFGQSYSATLTVTNDRGVKASTTKTLAVGAGAAPTAAFVISPTEPHAGTTVYFDATASQPGTGHHIVGYAWNWGDGTDPGTDGPTASHTFTTAATYTVTLTVKDETNQSGTTSKTVEIEP
jgi:PKD repeat protein